MEKANHKHGHDGADDDDDDHHDKNKYTKKKKYLSAFVTLYARLLETTTPLLFLPIKETPVVVV